MFFCLFACFGKTFELSDLLWTDSNSPGDFFLPTFDMKHKYRRIFYYFEVMQVGLCPKAFYCVHIDKAKI